MMDYLSSRVQESRKSGENAEKVEILSKQRRVRPIHLWKTKIDYSRDAFDDSALERDNVIRIVELRI